MGILVLPFTLMIYPAELMAMITMLMPPIIGGVRYVGHQKLVPAVESHMGQTSHTALG